ncbi:MAG: hypothetical protein NUV85_00960 [Candidatus Berkelbacteria bacterium]|nr:hypothetical protein [Candidatus Berkelbacteria bacterium]
MQNTPLFKSSKLGSRLVVLPTHIEYKPSLLAGKITIPIKDVASVENIAFSLAFFGGMREIVVETSGGKRYKVIVHAKDRDGLVEAILKAKG